MDERQALAYALEEEQEPEIPLSGHLLCGKPLEHATRSEVEGALASAWRAWDRLYLEARGRHRHLPGEVV